tara:strand:- start:147 stop:359 length:213 start_codon:yes stop_codon:yes gene_type:complete
MFKIFKQYVVELRRANDLKERELNLMLDPYYKHINKQEVVVQIPQLNNLELKKPDTGNPNWTVFSSEVKG